MPVSELVKKMSPDELASWAAYEEACGELSDERMYDLLASIHEQIQLTNWMMAEQFFTGETSDGNKVMNFLGEHPKDAIRRVPRQHDDYRYIGPGHILSGRVDIQTYDRLYGEINDPELEEPKDDTEDGEAE